VKKQFRNTVQPMHLKYVASQARWAEVVLHEGCGRREITTLVARLCALVK
jgi:uridine kinase